MKAPGPPTLGIGSSETPEALSISCAGAKCYEKSLSKIVTSACARSSQISSCIAVWYA